MKYTQLLFGAVAALIAGLIYASPVTAEAGPECSMLPQSICDSSTKDSGDNPQESGVFQIVIWVLRILTGAVGIAAVGALIFAGVLYSSAGGDSGQIGKAKTIITDTAIGVVVYGFTFIILNWLIPGGIFG